MNQKRINAQAVTKEEMKAVEKAVKHLKEDPSSTHESKGKRGHPCKQ